MTKQEISKRIKELREIFDIVRLVDADRTKVYEITETGELEEQPFHCHSVWKKESRCENCISARVCKKNPRLEKFEFAANEIYHVTSKYVEVEGISYSLEIVSHTTDDTLIEAYGKEGFISTIKEMNQKMYMDPVANVYNRRYYKEQVSLWKKNTALAMIDIDNFKQVNDTYGHMAGDEAILSVAKILKENVRNTDAVIRFGGDEFIMVFVDIPKETFASRLEEVRKEVEKIQLPDYPGMKLSISIGGAYLCDPVNELLEEADAMLYKAKETKNRVMIR